MIDVTCPHCETVSQLDTSEAPEIGVTRVFYDEGREREEVALGLWFACPACGEMTGVVTEMKERDA